MIFYMFSCYWVVGFFYFPGGGGGWDDGCGLLAYSCLPYFYLLAQLAVKLFFPGERG